MTRRLVSIAVRFALFAGVLVAPRLVPITYVNVPLASVSGPILIHCAPNVGCTRTVLPSRFTPPPPVHGHRGHHRHTHPAHPVTRGTSA